MIILDTSDEVWRLAQKEQSITAKPMRDVISDPKCVGGFLLNTLEGAARIDIDAMYCYTERGDVWQQSSSSLLKKYTVESITHDGWLICHPKPNVPVQFFELVPERHSTPYDSEEITIRGRYGALIDGIPNLQHCQIGDFVLRNPNETTDQWVVRKHLFLNTYKEIL